MSSQLIGGIRECWGAREVNFSTGKIYQQYLSTGKNIKRYFFKVYQSRTRNMQACYLEFGSKQAELTTDTIKNYLGHDLTFYFMFLILLIIFLISVVDTTWSPRMSLSSSLDPGTMVPYVAQGTSQMWLSNRSWGGSSQEPRSLLEAGKHSKKDSPLQSPKGIQVCWHLDFSPWDSFCTSDLQNPKIVSLCCLKPLSSWSFVQ